MNTLDEKVLSEIFLRFESLHELLRVSSVCRRWREIIIGKEFLQKRFIHRRDRYLINHWKFDNISNLSFDLKSTRNTDEYYQRGDLQQEKCFLGSCLVFDAHSLLSIPLDNCQSEQFSISVWIQNTSSVNSWRTVFDITLFESQCGYIHLGITPQSRIESSFSLSPSRTSIKCRSYKQNIVRHLWYHSVILVSKDKQQLFLNGHFQREIKRNLNENNQMSILMNELNIGANSKGFHCWFGRIADLSIWNRWLDSIEIRAIWQQRVSIDQTDLGQYLVHNINTNQSTAFQSVLL